MPLFKEIMLRLRLRQMQDERIDAGGEQQDEGSNSSLTRVSRERATISAHTDWASPAALQTVLGHVRTRWLDDSSLADSVDSEDMQRSPEGPTRIYVNFNMRHIDTDTSSTEESVCYMESGRLKSNIKKPTCNYAASDARPQNTKRYDPPYQLQAEGDWHLRAARNLKGTGSLRSFSIDHLRERHFLQTRKQPPQDALQAAWQQALNELRALHLENEAVTEAAAKATYDADLMEGQVFALRVRTERMRTGMEEMSRLVEKRKAGLAIKTAAQL